MRSAASPTALAGTVPWATASTRWWPRRRPALASRDRAQRDGSRTSRPEPVGHHDALEAPFLLEHSDQEVPILTAELPAELVVGGHHHADASLPNSRFEGGKVDLAERALVDLDVDRHPFDLLIVAHEVLDGAADSAALHASYIGHGHDPAQERILGETLEAAATNRVPLDVDRRRKEHTSTLVERLVAEHLADQLHKVAIPRRRKRRRRWHARRDLAPTRAACAVGSVGHVDTFQAQVRGARCVPPTHSGRQGRLIHEAQLCGTLADGPRAASSSTVTSDMASPPPLRCIVGDERAM